MDMNKLGKYALSGAIFAAAFTASAADYTVNESGDWSNASVWGDGTGAAAPELTASDNVIFGKAGITSNVNADTTVGTIDASKGGITVGIGKDNTLTVSDIKVGDKNTTVTIGTTIGEGKLKLNAGMTTAGNYVFNSKVDSSGFSFSNSVAGITMTFNDGFYAYHANADKSRIIMAKGEYFILGENSTSYLKGIFNMWGASGLLMNTGSSLTTEQGVHLKNVDIYGKIETSGYQGSDKIASVINGATFRSGSEFLQTGGGNGWTNNIKGAIKLSKGVKTFSVSDPLCFNDGLNLKLYNKNLITVDGQEQAYSTFYLQNRVSAGVLGASKATIELFEDNDFGTFDFYGDSVLNIVLNGYNTVIGNFTVNAAGGNVLVYFTDLDSQNSVKISDSLLKNILTETDADGNLRAKNLLVGTADSNEKAYLIKNGDNGYWVSSSAAVPEPATVASLFGLFALGFALYRKQR